MTAVGFEPKALGLRRDARVIARANAYDIASAILILALLVITGLTFRDYAISNDEEVQHRYGQMILAYYASGFSDLSLFNFRDLYLYGGLFDVAAIGLSHLFAVDPFDLRHLFCGLTGVAGIGATAATARLIAGPRAGFIAAAALAVSGAWFGPMFNHTKDIPLAAAMVGALYFLIRASRDLPRPRPRDVIGFGLLTGAALGVRVFGLLLIVYLAVAIITSLPRPVLRHPAASLRFVLLSIWMFAPALLLAYLIMIAAWPWSHLALFNPIRGLFIFADFHYHIRTLLAGAEYEMATVPRWYVPIYVLVKLPLLTLFGAVLALILIAVPNFAGETINGMRRRETALVVFAVVFPLACQVIGNGPAFTGLRHFLFVVPPMSILAGIAFDASLSMLAKWRREIAGGAMALLAASLIWHVGVLVRLHPHEYLYYNPLVGGLQGASGRYVTDYWVNIMPEAVADLEDYLKRSMPRAATESYTVGVCGERLPFEKRPHPHLEWTPDWPRADFFIAPTHMSCDRVLAGRVVATIERMGVVIGVVKDRRAITRPEFAQAKEVVPDHTMP